MPHSSACLSSLTELCKTELGVGVGVGGTMQDGGASSTGRPACAARGVAGVSGASVCVAMHVYPVSISQASLVLCWARSAPNKTLTIELGSVVAPSSSSGLVLVWWVHL